MWQIMRGGVLLLALTGLTNCSPNNQNRQPAGNPEFGIQLFNPFAEILATQSLQFVLEDGTPLANADVLIGETVDRPFTGNFLKTDGQGSLLVPADWKTPLTVTVSSPLAVRTSYLEQLPNGQTYTVRKKLSPQKVELAGATTGFQPKNGDDIVDFALSMPAFQRRDLFNFQIGSVISPERDQISAGGQTLSVPSNTTLPKQSENYAIVTVKLDKPNYRFFFDDIGAQKVLTLRGQFPFKKVVKQFRNKKGFVDVLNDFSFQGGSLVDVNLNPGTNRVDLPVNQFNLTGRTSARVGNYNSDEVALAVAINPQAGVMLPSDVKVVDPSQTVNLAVFANSAPHYLAVLKKRSEMQSSAGADHLSASIVPFAQSNQAIFLPMIGSPQLQAWNSVKVQAISAPNGVTSAGIYAVLSQLGQTAMGVNVTPLWEVYSDHWSDTFTVPEWPGEAAPSGRLRWKASILATTAQSPVANGPQMLDSVTHASSNSVDF